MALPNTCAQGRRPNWTRDGCSVDDLARRISLHTMAQHVSFAMRQGAHRNNGIVHFIEPLCMQNLDGQELALLLKDHANVMLLFEL